MFDIQESRKPTPFEGHFVFLCSLLIYASFVASLSDEIELLRGTLQSTERVTSLLRLIREGIYSVLVVDFVLCCMTAPRKSIISRGSILLCGIGLILLTICTFYSYLLDLPFLVILSGLRFLEYVPLALISVIMFRSCGSRPFQRIGKAVFVFLLIESFIGALEVWFAPPLWGTPTFLGSRAFGTMPYPNIFGATVVFCYLFTRSSLSARANYFALLVTTFDVFASGSRAAILCLIFILGAFYYMQIRNVWSNAMLIMVGIFSSPVLLLLVGDPSITGRDTGLGHAGGFERIGVWSHVLTQLDSATNLLLGWGMGLGSNTVFSLYGESLKNTYISDSTPFFLIGSFGIFGVLLVAAVLVLLFIKLWRDPPGLALMIILTLQLLISQALELYPMNVLAMLLVGWRIGVTQGSESAPRHTPNGQLAVA